MIKSTLFAFLALFAAALPAQVCTNPQSQIDLHGNNIRARILNGGDLFWDLSEAQFIPNPTPGGDDPATIFAAGLWMGGVDPAGNLKLSAVAYRSDGKTDYWPGPLDPNTGTSSQANCANWDRHFLVRGSEIAAFLAALPDLAGDPVAAIAQFPSVMGWPARGNAHFTDIWGFDLPFNSQSLAGFFDVNGNGEYEPLAGDYPAVTLRNKAAFVPSEIVWCVFNDHGGGAVHAVTQGKAFPMEVQLTAWAFDCPDQPVLNNTVFTAHKMIYRGTDPVDSCFIGLWVDFDIGCYEDDYVGSAPGLDAFYAYNQDAVDGNPGATCVGLPTFGDHPPVQSVTFLSQSLDKFIGANNASVGNPPPGTADPDAPAEYYNYLTGHWKDGSPITYGGSGYQSGGAPTDYSFPSDPADSNGWSMCTENLPFADRRSIATFRVRDLLTGQPTPLYPGAINELVTAWTVHFTGELPCNLGATFDEIASVRTLFDDGFYGNVCSPLGTGNLLPANAISLSPNPANDRLTLRHQGLDVLAIDCYDAGGRLTYSLSQPRTEQNTLDTGSWPTGLYLVRVLTRQGSWAGKISVVR